MMHSNSKEREYFILSVHHCSRDDAFILMFRRNDSGYAFRLHAAGRHTEQQVMDRLGYYNDGDCNIAANQRLFYCRRMHATHHQG